ncbi:MAG: hypothetical protein ACM65M_10560 [Microcoleus sp.]
MSAAVDKLIELCCLGLVEHDGCLNPKQPSAKEVHNSIVAIAPVDPNAKTRILGSGTHEIRYVKAWL